MLSVPKKVIDNAQYYYHNNRCKVSITYTRNSTSPTSGVAIYIWKITKVVFEMPLPVATSGSISIAANTKTKSGSNLKTLTRDNNATTTFSLSATYNGVTVSGSVSLTSSGTVALYLS
ncbi:MAG: hypothetical protein K5829_01245 [Treponema sp.]|nr:hypothetical protein [Treponema sp.]